MDSVKTILPDFAIAHFPGGGGRGYAQAITEVFFEEHTGLSTYQLLPNVTVGSVGFLITAPLYLPHPDDPKRPLLSAQELCEIFPTIAANLPKKAGLILNRNDRTPLEQAILPYLGDYKLKDFIGSIHTTAHEIAGGRNSCVRYAKYINPASGEVQFSGDPEESVMDIALATTALPPVFRPHNGQIDLAFSNSIAVPVERFRQLHDRDAKGIYIRFGNFRMSEDQKHHKLLEVYGHLVQSLKVAIGRAISDHTYSQNLQLAETIFGKDHVYNLEQEITPKTPNAPSTNAILTTETQFKRIKSMTEAHIHANLPMYEQLADTLGEMAIRRMHISPDASFGNYNLRAVRTEPFFVRIAANEPTMQNEDQQKGNFLTELFSRDGKSRVIGTLMSAWQAVAVPIFGLTAANANLPPPPVATQSRRTEIENPQSPQNTQNTQHQQAEPQAPAQNIK